MENKLIITSKKIENQIYTVRGQQVMLDSDLASIYQVETKVFNQAVKRNAERFPENFRFQLAQQEFDTINLRSQIVTSSLKQYGGRRYATILFTEQGIAMLSSVLRSPQAVQVNIEIMRAFVRLRRILSEHQEISQRLNDLESRYDQQFKAVFDAIRALMRVPEDKSHRLYGQNWQQG